MPRIAVFCGSSFGHNSVYQEQTEKFADTLVANRIGVVYGGGSVGLMGVLADRVMELGGEVIGVIPKKLYEMEVGHDDISELHIVNTMHERKAMMMDLADGFVALPGGIGTLEEIMEVMTWSQIGYHTKPCAFLNTNGYYDHLQGFFDHMVTEGFVKREILDSIIISESVEVVVQKLLQTT